MKQKNYIDDKGNYQNVENLTLRQIYERGNLEGFKDGFITGHTETRENREIIAGLLLLLDWAIETGFGFDQIPEEYEKYKEDIKGRDYKSSLIYIGMQEARKSKAEEDHPEE